MKPCSLLVICFASCLLAASTMAQSDLATKLRSSISVHHWDPDSTAQQIATTLPEPRKESLAAIVQIVRDEIDAPLRGKEMDPVFIARCSHVLKAAADENAILAAFGDNLKRIGTEADSEPVAALSSCRNPKAVEVMAELARLRFEEIRPWLPGPPPSTWTENRRMKCEETECSFLFALKGLAMSANSLGKGIAQELRDQYVRRYDGSPHRERVLRSLETEFGIDTLLREQPQAVVPPGPAPAATSSSSPTNTHKSKSEASVSLTPPSQKQGASRIWMAIAAVVAGVVVVGFLIWFLRTKQKGRVRRHVQ